MITQSQIDEIEKLAKEATLGPWSYDDDELEIHSDVAAEGGGDPYHIVRTDGSIAENNARFISSVNPSVILDLIGELRRKDAELDQLNKNYISAINGRRDFRLALKDARDHNEKLKSAASRLEDALKKVKHNGCCMVCSSDCPACTAHQALTQYRADIAAMEKEK